jgi:hypothetical protein
VDIKGLDKATILAALYNHAKPLGLGMLHYTPEDMTIEKAQKLLDSSQTYFDYVQGRVMKVDLSSDELHTSLYNRDNGECAAEQIISALSA